jgi:hypothetical protein
MTREEAMISLATITKLSAKELEGFFACTDEERQLMVQAYKDAGTIPTPDTWDQVIAVIKTCAELAGYVLPILNVVQVVFAIAEG